MIKLSAVIIALNEEKRIARCFDSLIAVADEIVLVDGGSTDRTAEIAKEKGARVIYRRFEGFVEQVRFAAGSASHPYLLSIDADEALSSELIASIARVKADWQNDGYTLNRRNHYGTHPIKGCGWYPDRKLRLWDARKGSYGGRNPHYRVEMAPGASLGLLDGDLLHYGYASPRDHLKRAGAYSTIASAELRSRGFLSNAFSAVFHPPFRFFKSFILQRGFLDGRDGLIICAIQAFEVFLKYFKALR